MQFVKLIKLVINYLADECEKDVDETHIPKLEQTSVVLVEQNDASPKPICRGITKDKRSIPR